MVSVDRIKGLSSSLAVKAPVLAATTAPITLSGLQTIDTVSIPSGGRVLVKDQADTTQNGWYDASTSAWTRSLDADANNDLTPGTLCLAASGTLNGGYVFRLVAGSTTVLPGTTAMTFTGSFALSAVSVFIKTLLDDADEAAALTTLGVSAFIQTLLDDADETTARETLGLEIGADVQAYDADIATAAASQAEMEAGTEAELRSMSPLGVAQAIAALGGGGGGVTEADIQSQTYQAFTTGGSATAFTLTPTPAIAANADKILFFASFHAAAGASPTLAVSGQTALGLRYYDSAGTLVALDAAHCPSGWKSRVVCNGTYWIVLDVPATDPAHTHTTFMAKDMGASYPIGVFMPFQFTSSSVAVGATTAAANLTLQNSLAGSITGSWRNITNAAITSNAYGLFQRVS